MNKDAKWVTDLIGSDYQNWKPGFYALSIGTGRGKTTFIKDRIIPYAKFIKAKVLYLCNREPLIKQNEDDMKGFTDTVKIMTYQKLQSDVSKHEEIGFYDYVVCDEVHFFFADSPFNPATDVAFDYVMKQTQSIVIMMSATAEKLFHYLETIGKLEKDKLYRLPQDYSYVDNVFLYDSKAFFTLIDNILQRDAESKVIAFVNEARMIKAHKYYGDTAEYMCSRHTRSAKLMRICGVEEVEITTKSGASKKKRTAPQIIKTTEDGSRTFEKRVLFTTKVLDNGVSLVDRNIRYVFCELLDPDSMLQALGRKRSIDEGDRCSFYIKNFQANWIKGSINRYEKWLSEATALRQNREIFAKVYENPQQRDSIKGNKVLYADLNGWHVNNMRYQRFLAEKMMFSKMLEEGYQSVLTDVLGNELSAKLVSDYTEPVYKDDLKDYLETIPPDRRLYKKEQDEIKARFKEFGLNMKKVALKGKRPPGISALNGVLEDRYGTSFLPRFINKDAAGKYFRDKRKKLEDGSINPNHDKQYWYFQSP